MYVILGNKKIPLYTLDYTDSLTNRIAMQLGVLPKYLYFPKGIQLQHGASIQYVNLVEYLKTVDISMLEKIRSKIPLDKQELLYLYVVITKKTKNNLQSLVGSESEYFPTQESLEQFWQGRQDFVTNTQEHVQRQKRFVKARDKQYALFDKVTQTNVWESTNFNIERVNLKVELDIKDISLMELFNMVVLNEKIPFCTINDYYKILKDYIPERDWATSKEEQLLLKVNEREVVVTNAFQNYTNVSVFFENEKVYMHLRLNIVKGYLDRDQFIQRTLSCFTKPIEILNMVEKEVGGVFYFPKRKINTHVFSDLVMNNSLFSTFMYTDENTKTTKRKSGDSAPWLYIYFSHPLTGPVTARISQIISQRGDPILKKYSQNLFPIGSTYVRVKITKIGNIDMVENFVTIFSKFLLMYEQQYDSIVAEYRKYIPNFAVDDEKEDEVQDLDMSIPKNALPEVFVQNYSRMCGKEKQPTVVDDTTAQLYKKRGRQVLKFPRDKPDNGEVYPSDGENQKNFVCLNPKFPYPGVQQNNILHNKDIYPYVPCCFSTDQRGVARYREYVYGEQVTKRTKKQQDFIRTDKFVGYNAYGILPNALENMFKLLDPNPLYQYIRFGVARTPSSFLNALMFMFPNKINIRKLNKEQVLVKLNAIRKRIATKTSLCRQSRYDASSKQIASDLESSDVYMDPKLYCQMLESIFECNIFLFNRDQLILPRYAQGYYKYQNDYPSVFIYENWGSESDNAKYPQCEILVRWNVEIASDIQYVFPHDHNIARRIMKIFNLRRVCYSLNRPITNKIFNVSGAKIISQSIDSYGKTRQFNLQYRDTVFSLYTEPIPPIYVNEDNTMYRVSKDIAEEFFYLNKSEISHDSETNKIFGTIGNVNVHVDIGKGVVEPNSQLTLYNKNKKIARYMVEYMYWLFSRFLSENSEEEITPELIEEFAKTNVNIVPDFKYKNTMKTFSFDPNVNGGIIKNKKLVVTSSEMLKRLLYVLRMYMTRSLKTLVLYKNKTVIQHYYKDITDFDSYPNQVILHGDESLEKWIYDSMKNTTLHDSVTIGNSPYFFKNALLGKNVLLAQNTTSLGKAIAIGKDWVQYGYNSSLFAKDDLRFPKEFAIFSYVNSQEIRRLKGSKNGIVKILAYKRQGIPFYTVLMNI